ncbi:DUF4123 domain-containing protein [Rhizobium helianthi]|uniref:DUF4123 domain-containing protein n=1 Tax=Rhizobium helianthi TaxID=1132695 RepID=A0ABW4M8R8_9HYPH
MPLHDKTRKILVDTLLGQSDAGELGILYAVIDASRSPMTIPAALQAMTDKVACLYRGQALEEFGDDTAWVAAINLDESVLDWLIDNGFGKRWSIFLRSSLQLADIVRHLRKFTVIQDDQGTTHFFRFYDPRTLRQYLPVFTTEQRTAFFRGVHTWYCENDVRPNELLKFSTNGDSLLREAISLVPTQGTVCAID